MQKKQHKNILTKEQFDFKGRDYMYRALIENMSEGAVVISKKQTIVYSNKHFAKLTEYDLRKIIGANFNSMLSKVDNEKFLACIDRATNNRSYCQLKLVTKNGEEIPILVSVDSFEVETESFFSVFVNDISPQQEIKKGLEQQVEQTALELSTANRRLNNNNKELSAINEYLDNFVHAVAHDLRTPVANLKLISKMIKIAPEKEKPRLIKSIGENINTLDSTLKGLVQIIETQDKSEINKPGIDIINIVREVIKHKTPQIKAQNGTVTIEMNTDEKINHVEGYIYSIARNMIDNALKYANPDHDLLLKISLHKKDNYFILGFSDNGIGMDMKKAGKTLFKPFQRYSNNNSKGMGIGLHIINNMVRRNGGFIDVESKPGKGTSFLVHLKEFEE